MSRRNSRWLGFLPDGAIDAYANQQSVLVATAPDGEAPLGYVIYREARNIASLVHLCVNEVARGRGVARSLLEGVLARTRDLHGLKVTCRRDFPANSLWPRLGFAAIRQFAGRGKTASLLTEWWLDYGQPNLFSLASEGTSPTDIGIDLNVALDLDKEDASIEVKSLDADWLVGDIRLCITPEALNEADRIPEADRRKGQKRLLSKYEVVWGSPDPFQTAYGMLTTRLGPPKTLQEESDYRHLAHLHAAGLTVFVTSDRALLNRAADVEELIGVQIRRPSFIIRSIDKIQREHAYRPADLAGLSIEVSLLSADVQERVIELFNSQPTGERKNNFATLLSGLVASPRAVSTHIVRAGGELVSVVAVDHSVPAAMTVPVLRVTRGPHATTLARGIVGFVLDAFVASGSRELRVTDRHVGPLVSDALSESGFTQAGQEWVRLNLGAVASGVRLKAQMAELAVDEAISPLGRKLAAELADLLSSDQNASATERRIWPAKLLESGISSVIVPIKAIWASELFDVDLARRRLLKPEESLMLRWENVYYRAPRSAEGLHSGSRVLWYVTQATRWGLPSSVRAASTILSVEIVDASQAFQRYRRLGVYERRDVLDTANSSGRVMAMRFGQTELFREPIPRPITDELIRRIDGRPPIFRGPFPISEKVFAAIYTRARGSA